MSLMIKNAHAILSGLPGEAARLAGPDIRIRDGKIASYREFADTATLADAWRGD